MQYSDIFKIQSTPNQKIITRTLHDPLTKIAFVTGPAGSGKTLHVSKTAFTKLHNKKVKKIVLTRPTISVDEEIGFLPGDINHKMHPWMLPLFDYISKHNVNFQNIEICPLGFMRGRTFENSFIIADEMQNATIDQMQMLLTRLGNNSILAVTGDLDQSDITDNGLEDFLIKYHKFDDIYNHTSIRHITLDEKDIKRSEVTKHVLDIYNENFVESRCNDEPIIYIDSFYTDKKSWDVV